MDGPGWIETECTSSGLLLCNSLRRRKMPRTLNTIGTIFESGFATVAAVGLQPLMCYTHPNGLNSVLRYPEVICGSESHMWMPAQRVLLWSPALHLLSFFIKEKRSKQNQVLQSTHFSASTT